MFKDKHSEEIVMFQRKCLNALYIYSYMEKLV